MTTSRRRETAAAGAAAAVILSGCAGVAEVAAPAAPTAPTGAITVATCPAARPLVPSDTAELCGMRVLDAVTARLVRYDRATGRALNDLAASIVTKDAQKFTITLRSNARYSDGTPVRAADFVKAWNRGAYGPNKQANQFLFQPIAGFHKVAGKKPRTKTLSGLKVTGERTFTVKLSRPGSTFPQRLGMLAFAPLPPSFFADNGAAFQRRPVGAGPYRVESGSPSGGFVLSANPGYTGPTPPSVGRVTLRPYADHSEAWADLLAGDVDLMDEVSLLTPQVYERQLGDRIARAPSMALQMIWFPSPKADRSYGNAKLRRALSLAIDRNAVVRAVWGRGAGAATGWSPPGAFGTDRKGCGPACAYNPKQAKKLFKEAGGHAAPLRISFHAGADHEAWVKAVCRSIQSTLGVTCKPTAVRDFATFRSRVENRKQTGMFRAGWLADYPSLENFLTPQFASGAVVNDGDFSDAKFDTLLAKAARTADPAKANAVYRQAERRLRTLMPAIPLYYPVIAGGWSTDIASASLGVFGIFDLTTIELA